jgi:hypothetical protein
MRFPETLPALLSNIKTGEFTFSPHSSWIFCRSDLLLRCNRYSVACLCRFATEYRGKWWLQLISILLFRYFIAGDFSIQEPYYAMGMRGNIGFMRYQDDRVSMCVKIVKQRHDFRTGS